MAYQSRRLNPNAPIFNPAQPRQVLNKPSEPAVTIIPGVARLTTSAVRASCTHRIGCANQISYLSGDEGICFKGWQKYCVQHQWDPQLCKELNIALDATGYRTVRSTFDLEDLRNIFQGSIKDWKKCKGISPTRKRYVRPRSSTGSDSGSIPISKNVHRRIIFSDSSSDSDSSVIPTSTNVHRCIDSDSDIEEMVASWFR